MDPVMASAPVTARTTLGAYVVLTMAAPPIAAGVEPGQFVNVAVDGHLLRRPFSVYASDPARGTLAIAFDAIGEGTRWLATRAPGDVLELVGPLGVGFAPAPGRALLVGGGYGTAALSFLASALDGPMIAVVGARTADRLFIDESLRERSLHVYVTTDDGTEGRPGVVTDVMPELLRDDVTVYACGPNPMLAAVGAMAARAGVASRLAVEEFMACGLGVCWTCVVPVRANGALTHARACTEGPVFAGEELAWST